MATTSHTSSDLRLLCAACHFILAANVLCNFPASYTRYNNIFKIPKPLLLLTVRH